MKNTKILFTGFFVLLFSVFSAVSMAADTIDAEDFVDEASAKGIAEVESAKLALDKATLPAVKELARKIIDDHTGANRDLRAIATKKNLKVADEAELASKAKMYILKQRDGESFDEAYVKNQINAHKDAIELFKKAAKSTDAELRAFAVAALPKLEHHLKSAQALEPLVKHNNEHADDHDHRSSTKANP